MRPWLLGGLAAAVAALGFVVTRDEQQCSPSSAVYDGNVLPGGPQTAAEALEGFLSVGADIDASTGEPMPGHASDYETVSESANRVTFVAGTLRLHASRQPLGWMIGGASNDCSVAP